MVLVVTVSGLPVILYKPSVRDDPSCVTDCIITIENIVIIQSLYVKLFGSLQSITKHFA